MRSELVEFDPTSEEFRADRSGIFRKLRDQGPAYLAPDATTLVLSRYADVVAAASEWDLFSSELFGNAPPLELLNLFDPPAHTELKMNISQAYSPQRVLALEPNIRTITRSLINELKKVNSGDVVHRFVRPLTTRVMGSLLGFTDDQLARCQTLTDAALFSNEGIFPFLPLIQELVADHRTAPRDDLMSALLTQEGVPGGSISEDAVLAFCWGIILGNNCTTMNSIANGIFLLASSTKQWQQIVENPSLIPQAFEEMMRCEPPTHSSDRVTTKEVDLHGVSVPARTPVRLMWGAASLDEQVFEHPDRFDIHRRRVDHLALGWGAHHCIGAALARLEAHVAFEELVAAFPRVAIVGKPERIPSAWQWGFGELFLEFHV
jgi:cytochrome P450